MVTGADDDASREGGKFEPRGRLAPHLVVLDGEEDKAAAGLLENGLVGVASDGGVADEAVTTVRLAVVDKLCRLALLAEGDGCLGGSSLLGSVELVGE